MQPVVSINRNELIAQQGERISLRAYELYEARGREDGHDLEDWLQAEAQVAHEIAQVAQEIAEDSTIAAEELAAKKVSA